MKKNEELLHSIGEIDNRYIENAKPQKTKKKKIIWIGFFSAAACIIALLGWQYCFVIKPLHDIENNNTTVTELSTTEETTLSEPTQTDNDIKTDQEKEYPDIKTVDMNTTSTDNINKIQGLGFDGENVVVQESVQFETDYDNRYIYLTINSGSESKTISLPEIPFVNSDQFDSTSDVCYNDNYIFLFLSRTLWSVSMKNHNVISHIDSFDGSIDLSSGNKCLGVDTSGHVYMLAGSMYPPPGEPNYHLLKYTHDLKLVSEYITMNNIPFTHIINFDDMYIDQNNILSCKYNDDQTVSVNLSDGSVLSDNIVIDDDYWYIKDDNDNTPLKMYSPNQSEVNSCAVKNCIDSNVILSAEGGDNISFTKMNTNGEFIDRYTFPSDIITSTGFDFNPDGNIVLPVQNVNPFEKFEILTYNIDSTDFTKNAFDFDAFKSCLDPSYLYKCRMVDFMADNDYYFLNRDTVNKKYSYGNIIYKCSPENNSETLIEFKNNSLDICNEKLVLLNNKPCFNFGNVSGGFYCCDLDFENGTYSEPYQVPGLLYPQQDGTVVYIADSALYSYPDNTKIFDLPENLLPENYKESSCASNIFITKIDDSRYVYVSNPYTAKVHFLTQK